VQADKVKPTVDELPFETFFEREDPTLVRLLFAMTSDLAEAEDLAQEAMSRTWEHWATVRAMDSPTGYAYRAALNLARNRLRHLKMRARRLPLLRPPTPVEPHIRGEVVSALAMLPSNQRAAVLLVEWVGMTTDEAGRVLGITAEAVRSRVHRARRTLQSSLEEEDG
jgi:RNA polymerase sigma-70 factor (ECF subfamily)